jgi:hypothetical protein
LRTRTEVEDSSSGTKPVAYLTLTGNYSVIYLQLDKDGRVDLTVRRQQRIDIIRYISDERRAHAMFVLEEGNSLLSFIW